MLPRILVRLLLVLMMMPAVASAQSKSLTVLVMGDSLSAAHGLRAEQGWVALADRDSKRYRFANASVSGETSAGGRSRILAELDRTKPDIVVVELGANDGLRGLPLGQLGENLGWIIGASQARGARVLLIGMRMPPNMGPDYAREFHASFGSISKRLGTGLIPYFLEPLGTDRSLFQADNLHPTAEAQPMLAKSVLQALERLPPKR